jgi:hypothetical protein
LREQPGVSVANYKIGLNVVTFEVLIRLPGCATTCLRKDPDERWQTVHDLKLELESFRDAPSGTLMPAHRSHESVHLDRAVLRQYSIRL